MILSLVRYRLMLAKVRNEEDLKEVFQKLYVQDDLETTNKQALCIYRNQRIFNNIILTADNAFLIAELAKYLLLPHRLELMRSNAFLEHLLKDKDAVRHMDAIQAWDGELLKRICSRLVGKIQERYDHERAIAKPPAAKERGLLLNNRGSCFPKYGEPPFGNRKTRYLVWKPPVI